MLFKGSFVPEYTATVLFHRFFARRSMLVHNPKDFAFACLFLAGKVEEHPIDSNAIIQLHLKEVAKLSLPECRDMKSEASSLKFCPCDDKAPLL